MSAAIVIALYRPQEGKAEEFVQLLKEHIPTLREYGLITDRPVILAKASDDTIIEIFEWVDGTASSRQAHQHPAIARIWERMGEIGTFAHLSQLPEATKAFAHFTPLTLPT